MDRAAKDDKLRESSLLDADLLLSVPRDYQFWNASKFSRVAVSELRFAGGSLCVYLVLATMRAHVGLSVLPNFPGIQAARVAHRAPGVHLQFPVAVSLQE